MPLLVDNDARSNSRSLAFLHVDLHNRLAILRNHLLNSHPPAFIPCLARIRTLRSRALANSPADQPPNDQAEQRSNQYR